MASEIGQKERPRKIFSQAPLHRKKISERKEVKNDSQEDVSFFVLRKFLHDRSLGRPFFARNLFRSFCLGLQFS
jgi:hypothetical protein